MDRNSLVGIATRYRLDGAGLESRWRQYLPIFQIGTVAHPATYTVGSGYFPGVKRPRRGVERPPPSSAEVEEKVELYLYYPSGLSWPVIEWNFPLPLLFTGLSSLSNGTDWLYLFSTVTRNIRITVLFRSIIAHYINNNVCIVKYFMIHTLLIYCGLVGVNYKLYKIHGTYINILVTISNNNFIINTTCK